MRIAFLSDSHIDYATGHRHTPDGVNMRAQDGYDAFTATITSILEHDVDVVLHGGDLFHAPQPTVRGMLHARRELSRLHAAGIPVYAVVGNHDHPNNAYRLPASMAVHSPEMGVHVVDGAGALIRLADGLLVHAVPHGGLMPLTADPEPSDGVVNILLTHGAAEIEGYNTKFTCEDSPAEAWIPKDILQRDWNLLLTGHYHNRHRLPLPYPGWYAGSSLRRGFSDPAGERGWLQVDVASDGSVAVTEHNIAQRPQFDLPIIDAANLTGDEVFERMQANIESIAGGLGAPIVRQNVVNIPSAVRKTIPVDRLPVSEFFSWQVRFARPETGEAVGSDGRTPHMTLTEAWDAYADKDASILAADKPQVMNAGRALLNEQVPD